MDGILKCQMGQLMREKKWLWVIFPSGRKAFHLENLASGSGLDNKKH